MSIRLAGSTLALIASLALAPAGESSPETADHAQVNPKSAHEDFPNVVAFERGAVQFEGGDEITITEVCSTSEDMQSGICRISGTYTLASEDEATLAASVTASDAADGRGPWNSAQKIEVAKGKGSFVLMLPISIKGWPHVSFYAHTKSIGGVYLGTGESVLRHGWD